MLSTLNNHQNTTGDSKAKVAKWMGEAILPELFKLNPQVVGDQVKGKIDAYMICSVSTPIILM
jgi:hypothetical protein